MSQMPRQAALPTCPSCAEPLDAGDRFCGACGYDLSAVPPGPDDHPTLTMNGSAQPSPPEGTPVSGTAVPGAGVSGTTVSGAGVSGVSGVRFDRPSEPDEYALQAPDPRVAAEAAVVAEPAKVCVACRAGRVDDDGYCENCGHAQPRERDHMELESGPLAAVSDRGLRHHRNEDSFGLGRTALPDGSPALVAIVCDGVSSATRPDDASLAASKAASESLLAALPQGTHPQQAMHEAIVAASYAVNALADEPPRPASTPRTRTLPPAPWSGRSSRPGCWSSAGSATAAPTGSRRTAVHPRPGSPRTTRGPRRWSPRA